MVCILDRPIFDEGLEIAPAQVFNLPLQDALLPIVDLCEDRLHPPLPTAYQPTSPLPHEVCSHIHGHALAFFGIHYPDRGLLLYNAEGSLDGLLSSVVQLLQSSNHGPRFAYIHLITGGRAAFEHEFPGFCERFELQHTSFFDLPQRVRAHLFIGGALCVTTQTAHLLHIDGVLNAGAHTSPIEMEGLEYLFLPMEDDESTVLAPFLEQAVPFIHRLVSQGRNVLVHCRAGVSRSASCVIAYLMREEQFGYEEALGVVKAARSCVCPNDSFEAQLKALERRV